MEFTNCEIKILNFTKLLKSPKIYFVQNTIRSTVRLIDAAASIHNALVANAANSNFSVL